MGEQAHPGGVRAVAGSRHASYDVIRLTAMAGVVAIHVLAAGLASALATGSIRFWLLVPDRALNDLCVPAFLFLTGALVWRPSTTHGAAWWRRRLEVVFIPYLAWTFVYLGVGVARDGWPGLAAFAQRSVVAVLTGNGWFHLYFPPLLVIVYLLRAPAARLVRHPALLLVVTLAAQALLAVVFHTVRMPQPAALMLTNFLTLLPYASLGGWYASEAPRLVRHRLLVSVAGLAGLAVVLLQAAGVFVVPRDPYFGLWQRIVLEAGVGAFLVGAAVLLGAAEDRLARRATVLHSGAGLSYGVYLSHPLLTLGLVAVVPLTSALWAAPWFLGLAFAAILAAALALTWALKATKPTAWLA
jgi:surface polysaccharide O-acyltransferase-like enzyme